MNLKLAFGLSFGLSFGVTSFAQAQSFKTGYQIPASKLDDPDYYLAQTKTGAKVKQIYGAFSQLRGNPVEKLPEEFSPMVHSIQKFILAYTNQDDSSSDFYVGPNGSANGHGFDFSANNLPHKLTKLAFCFGVDPFVFSGLIQQESFFQRNAKSSTGASGFAQLTPIAIAEVSEQLDILGPDFRGEGAPEVFQEYINCYLGPKKKWVNMWEDNTIPAGKAAYTYYRSGKKSKRTWKYGDKARKWLNQDPDRNLIYGAVLFKLYLGIYGEYSKALRQYNVSHPEVYTVNVKKYYQSMLTPFLNFLKKNSFVAESGRLNKVDAQEILIGNSVCRFGGMDFSKDIAFAELLQGLYPDQEIYEILTSQWTDQGLCHSNLTEI